jgi:hypothetical protein
MAFWLSSGTAGVQAQCTPELTGIAGPLTWINTPAAFAVEKGSALSISAGPKTDWFVDPFDAKMAKSAPILVFVPAENFVLSTKVKVNFGSKRDAGALMLWADDHHWAKFSLELSPEKQPTVVTVVTRGVSDDCNLYLQESGCRGDGPADHLPRMLLRQLPGSRSSDRSAA